MIGCQAGDTQARVVALCVKLILIYIYIYISNWQSTNQKRKKNTEEDGSSSGIREGHILKCAIILTVTFRMKI